MPDVGLHDYTVYLEYSIGGQIFEQTIEVPNCLNSAQAYGRALASIALAEFGEQPSIIDASVDVDDR